MRLSFAMCLLPALIGPSPARAEVKSLKVDGEKILVNDEPAKLWGVRIASAALRDEYTKELLESLDFYKGKGVNALALCYQGSMGLTARVFAPDGQTFADTATRDRMRKIIEAAAARDMVVIVTLFFPRKVGAGSEDPRLASREAYLAATKLAAEELKSFKNVVVSIAQDAGPGNWSAAPMRFVPADAIACLQAVAEVAPAMPRGCGSAEHSFNVAIAASDAATVIMQTESGTMPPKFAQAKPAINVALLGRDSGGRSPQGVWTEAQMKRFAEAVERYSASPKDHLIAHFQGWHEGGMDMNKNRFTPGGAGTRKDPGTAWFFDALASKTNSTGPAPSTRPVFRSDGKKTIFD